MAQIRVPRFIDGFGKSYAMLSGAPGADTAVIFVHGFGGKPTSTWRDFHGLVDEYSPEFTRWATSDMFFYAYESLHTPIRRNAELLGDFVERVWGGTWQTNGAGSGNKKYKDLILAGHSEGGVIIRRLILDHYEANKVAVEKSNPTDAFASKAAMKTALNADFLLAADLKLFAPACMGINFSSWAGFLTSFSLFVSAITSTSLVRNELRSDSTVLKNLQRGTEQAYTESSWLRSLYTHPLFGDQDHIVTSDSYAGEKLLWDVGQDHFGVCKPHYSHKLPLEFIHK